MIVIGSIATKKEATEIYNIVKIDEISQRFQNLEGVHDE